MRSGSKSRSKNKWQLQPPHTARLRSRLFQSSKRGERSNAFFWIDDRTDAGTNPALGNNFFAINRLLGGLSKLRLFEPRGHNHPDRTEKLSDVKCAAFTQPRDDSSG